MSTTKRIISGSAASWARIGITIISQVVLVPLYLSHWDLATFGVWLAIQALITVLTTLDFGFQTYMEFEFLRLGHERKAEINSELWSGILVGITLSVLQLLIIVLLGNTSFIMNMLDLQHSPDIRLVHEAFFVLLLQAITWLIATSPTGLIGRALAPFGYYPRTAWWNVGLALVFSVSTAVAVLYGASLLQTGIVGAIASVAYAIPFYIDLGRILKKEGFRRDKISVHRGRQSFLRSILISGKIVLDNVRQQGVRLFIAPIAGIQAVAPFSTNRTAANFAMQGLNTITYPLMPELMRFLNQRSQAKFESAIGTVWIVVVAIIAPMMLLLQVLIVPIFRIWTHGKIQADPALFGLLSLGVLVYAWAQPAIAIVRGNNIVKPQLYISIVTAILVIGLMILFIKLFGLPGAGLGILIPEIVSGIWYRIIARKWLEENELHWPRVTSAIVVWTIGITFAGIALMVAFPALHWIIAGITLVLLCWNMYRFWSVLPALATDRVRSMIVRIPGANRILR